MLFNSFEFWLFFAIIFILYFICVHTLKSNFFSQIILLIASLFFYACWQPVYLTLIMFSVCITWLGGMLMEKTEKKKLILFFSLIINLTVLFIFKYFNFFIDSVNGLFVYLGKNYSIQKFDILLPVGISFYTFQALGYSIDVYRGKVKAEYNFITYALFVTFFPQLVAGPIERTDNLLPQFKINHAFNYDEAVSGLRLAAWGMFKKVVIADTLAKYVNIAYSDVSIYPGLTLAIATFFFSIQILCDFSGYSDIAIGIARVLGFNLQKNFNIPYLASSITEFWKNWHISLSTWFKDYLYIPLGGDRVSKMRHYANILIVFIISGLWHGAAWTFIIWGLLHGIYQIFERMLNERLKKKGMNVNHNKWGGVFILVLVAWVFFRAPSVFDAFVILKKILYVPYEIYGIVQNLFIDKIDSYSVIFQPYLLGLSWKKFIIMAMLPFIIFISDIISRKHDWQNVISKWPFAFRWLCYYAICIAIVVTMILSKQSPEFIYFQF